jgi:subtilisin family serine protease
VFRTRHASPLDPALPLVILLLAAAPLLALGAEDPPPPRPWERLSTATIEADAFLADHPRWDGRGVVIAVLDTGVDPLLAGLQETPTGEPKLVDFRDFSGEGDVPLSQATWDEDEHGTGLRGPEADGRWLRGIGSIREVADEDSVRVGFLDEQELQNSAVADLDGNGTVGDVFGVIVYATAEHQGAERRIVVDTDADGRLDDEEVRADFAHDPRTFTLGDEARRQTTAPLGIALNLWEDDPDKVTFVFDDGAHGSHVAGIAAGYRIGGQEGQNGIAPGAQVISLKLGNNELSGGATTTGSMWKAWHYAADYADEHDVPVVIQMSYGVGSENEGQAVMEREIDRLLGDNEGLVACVSNGNEGPGLSTAGLPACAARALGVGAVLNTSSAEELYGADLDQDLMFYFSSRGAEMAKPDVVTPGFAASTIPIWSGGRDVYRGTSMASPQAAGAVALLMSAARAEGLPVVGGWIRAAIRRGAEPIDGMSVLDQGPGMLSVPRAWGIYRELARREGPEPLEWQVETVSPELPGRSGPAAHWRGVTPPRPPERQEVTVTPVFRERVTKTQRAAFYRAFDLASTAGWVEPAQGSVHSRVASPMSFDLLYDPEALSEPGLYTARIVAYDKRLSRNERERLGPAWDVPVSVVVPHRPGVGESVSGENVGVDPGRVIRRFVRVPVGAETMRISVVGEEGSAQRAFGFIHDPEGRERAGIAVGGDGPHTGEHTFTGDDLRPGVWELDLYGHYLNAGSVAVDWSIGFEGVLTADEAVDLETGEGEAPTGVVELTSRATDTLRAEVTARITGYRVASTEQAPGGTLQLPVTLGPDIARVGLDLSMSAESWNQFTDVAVRLLDSDGAAVLSSGMGYRVLSARFVKPDGAPDTARYTLDVSGGLADPGAGGKSFDLDVERTYRYTEPIPVEVAGPGDGAAIAFYPDRPVSLKLDCARTPPALPDGARWVLELTFEDVARPDVTFTLTHPAH